VLIVVVDDRPTPEATELRAGIGAAVQDMGEDTLVESAFHWPDRATWHPVDQRLVLVPASSPSLESVASPASDAALAWTTNQVTKEGRDAWVRAAESAVTRMSAPAGAPFRPLERAEDVVRLLRGQRAPVNEKESALLGSLSTRHKSAMGVSIVAATDDESPHAAVLYRVDDPFFVTAMNVVTREERGEAPPDPARYPRLAIWAKGAGGSVGGGCFEHDVPDPPFRLFLHGVCAAWRFRCEVRPVAEISPGLGACHIQITTVDPPSCDASRGWADPLDADGVRRTRVDDRGERVCDLLPVEPRAMDACLHNETCADCGGGWCVSEVQPKLAERCPGSPRAALRWIGGALPRPGSVQVTCLEPEDRTAR
jgi:hypothetical protein